MAEPLLAQVLADVENVTPDSAIGVLQAIANSADEAAHTEGESVWKLLDMEFSRQVV